MSITVIVWLTGVAALPLQSTAVHVRVRVSRPQLSKLSLSVNSICTEASQSSDTVGAVNTGTYWLESVVDPNDQLIETDDTNNAARIKVHIDRGARSVSVVP